MGRWGDFHDTLIHVGVIKRPEKLDFGEPQASGILSPAYWRGGKFNRAQGVSPGIK